MDKQIWQIKPNYKKIYGDMINIKYPHKMESCKKLLDQDELSVLNIITLNRIIFNNQSEEEVKFNQKFRSYSRTDILNILNYQKENNLNNKQLAEHFRLSRNTVTKWKKLNFFE